MTDATASGLGPDLTWVAVHTEARREWLAAEQLRGAGYAVFLPHFAGVVSHGRRKIGVLRPLFGRYLFAGLRAGQAVGPISRMMGVSAVVYSGEAPLTVPGYVVGGLMMRCDSKGRMDVADPAVVRALARVRGAQRVKAEEGGLAVISRGPLRDLLVEIAEVDGSAAVTVWLRDAGTANQVRLSASAVLPILPAPRGPAPMALGMRRIAG
ncbi:transcriptional antiterminator RfaH [Pseudoxanthobacter soli DSM 19599]|uniref:Transcriptional antiterminator RfaH n=2 Tax=Pseudoxanthobacter TaxID=433838 RepID=A0A1M7ZLZ1_9HYPH|nr:transcriptional antiterminator RfaH [Pseudoxanthobacter soli DSM 19599]